jgi:hypothetical protein
MSADTVIEYLRHAQHLYDRFVSYLTPAEAMTKGMVGKWAAKDVIAHIIYWNDSANNRLERSLRGETISADENSDYLHQNDLNFEARRDWTWEQVEAEVVRVLERSIALVRQCSDEQLHVSGHFSWTRQDSVAARLVGNVLWHAGNHLAGYYVENGNADHALQVMRDLQTLYEPFEGGKHSGLIRYDTACIYARLGQAEQALALLPGAFQHDPDLIAWSRQDPDLVTLRDMPAFQTLTTQPDPQPTEPAKE